MTKTKRWGDSYIDRRNWSVCNEQLVRRGEYLLDTNFVSNWESDRNQMNLGKRGAPFLFPNSLIELQAIWHAKNIPFRMIEGITRKLAEFSKVPDYNDYTTANRRINKLACKLILPKSDNLTLFSDGTGLQVVESGEYLREKYGKKNRRWIQVIILGNPKTKEPVSFEVNLIQDSELDSAKRQLAELNKRVNIDVLVVMALMMRLLSGIGLDIMGLNPLSNQIKMPLFHQEAGNEIRMLKNVMCWAMIFGRENMDMAIAGQQQKVFLVQ